MSEMVPIFTSAGLAAIQAAHAQGLALKLTHLAIGDGAYDVVDGNGVALAEARALTALDNERLRVALSAGGAVSDNQVLVEAIVTGGVPEFWIKELGFIAEDGTLVCVWSSATTTLGYRGAADWVFRYVLAWVDLPANAITVVFDGDAAYSALSIDHERLEGKVRQTVADGGLVFDVDDNTQLTAAILALIAANIPVTVRHAPDVFTGDGVQTDFVLSHQITSLNDVIWFEGTTLQTTGLALGPDNQTITRTPAVPAGCGVVVRYL